MVVAVVQQGGECEVTEGLRSQLLQGYDAWIAQPHEARISLRPEDFHQLPLIITFANPDFEAYDNVQGTTNFPSFGLRG